VVLCAHPGEVLLTQCVKQAGPRVAIAFDAQVLMQYAAQLGVSQQLRFSPSVRMSPELAESLSELLETLRYATEPAIIDARIVAFLGLAFEQLMANEVASAQLDRTWYAAGRMCESLLNDTLAELDLNALAVASGLSRFQTLRAFKRRYGLPPHTYHLRVRLGLAQKRLREGLEPARVAAELGFVDQSHLTRHFRRFVGVTPGQYARLGGALLVPRAYVPE
jgi:AraC-like DNA-binding protein